MDKCLMTKKSNCKNCYKCIRHCPTKSLKMTDGQAHIIRDECILCGECYVVCPQYAKQIRNDVDKVKAMLVSGSPVYLSLAPSYAAKYSDYDFADVSEAVKRLGFAGVEETSVGAEAVTESYEKIIENNEQEIIISTCCPTVNLLIEKHFKNAVKYMAKVITPMHAHSKLLKERYPGCKVVFAGPCISKKYEAETVAEAVDAVLTFDELDNWMSNESVIIEQSGNESKKHKTNLYPTSGGVLRSMKKHENYDYIVIDGVEKCMKALTDIEKGSLKSCFIEMSACSGSCIEGPVMRRSERNPVFDNLAVLKNTGEERFTLDNYDEKLLDTEFKEIGLPQVMPNSLAIEEILKKMGKNTKEKELNCGSCGYDTCREKAIAVFKGKADLTMCMPYLKEKAESFSDTIVKNTPNGIIVLDEQLNVQMINNSARKILNLPKSTEIIGSPVVRILDPIDYVMAISDGKNVNGNQKYLAEYQKYVEETIIYDKEYHLVMIMMKDISREEIARSKKEEQSKAAIEITDKVVEKQMRIVQEIASLLGETTAETKIALTKLKETLSDE